MCWFTPIILSFGRLGQEDSEFDSWLVIQSETLTGRRKEDRIRKEGEGGEGWSTPMHKGEHKETLTLPCLSF